MKHFFFAAVLSSFFFAFPAAAAEAPQMVNKGVKPVQAIQKEKAASLAGVKPAKKSFPKEAKQSLQSMTGTVVSILKSTISIQVGETEENGAEEMLIRMDAGTKAKGVKKVSGLKYGDQVKVTYTSTVLPSKVKDEEPRILDMTATEIALVKTAAQINAESLTLAAPAAPAAQGAPNAAV